MNFSELYKNNRTSVEKLLQPCGAVNQAMIVSVLILGK